MSLTKASPQDFPDIISEQGGDVNSSTKVFCFDGVPAVVVTKFNAQPRLTKLYGLREENGVLLSYFTSESQRRQGFALRALEDTLSNSHVSVFASIFEHNVASIELAKKAGMERIATSSWKGDKVALFKG